MTTPKKEQIFRKAKELWHEDRFKKGDPSYDIEPEELELAEEGFLQLAQSQLMQDRHKAEIEQYFDYDNLQVSDFTFDIDEALKSGIYVCGTTGSGKSDLAMYAADRLMKHDVIVIVFDGSQDWLNRSDVGYYQTLEGSFINRIPQHSIIYDISQLTIPEEQSLVESFCRRLMQYQATEQKRRQYFLIFEEAHTYFPEGCMRAKRFQNTMKMMTQGRNFKVRFMAITQFSSLIDKTTMRYMTQRFLGNTNEPNDVAYLRKIIGDYADQLKALENGSFLYFNRGKVSIVQIEPFNAEKKPTQVDLPQSFPQIREKPKQQTSDLKAVSTLIICAMWFVAILVAASQMRGF